MTNREHYVKQLQGDESIQAMDVGTGFDFTKSSKNKKACLIVRQMAAMRIGYRMEYKVLATKKFNKWAMGAAWFKAGDMLAPSDVKAAVREFYRLVAVGELQWQDGSKKMLEFIRLIDGTYELRVVTFVPGLYRDTSADVTARAETAAAPEQAAVDSPAMAFTEAELAEAVGEVDVQATIEAMLSSKISPAERAILQRAMHDLKCIAKKSA